MLIVINGEPRTKKNSQQILINHRTGKPFVAPSKKYKEYEKVAAWEIWQQYHGRPVINERVNVKVLFYMKTHRRIDLCNLLEAVDDVLVKYDVLKDDNSEIVAGHDGSRVLYDKENPRTEVYITRMFEGE